MYKNNVILTFRQYHTSLQRGVKLIAKYDPQSFVQEANLVLFSTCYMLIVLYNYNIMKIYGAAAICTS